ncbi:MAG: FAD-dependent oxidoreductase [Deltaproteobacteria bacterium]|nr:FAD-dependent oxidoreductase [Deltaproteobacteria bacterium]
MDRPRLDLDFGLTYRDLFDPAALARLDETFREVLRAADAPLSARFEAYRERPASLSGPPESQLLVEVGRHVDAFVAKLFKVEAALARYRTAADDERAVMRLKKDLWRKRGQKLVGTVGDRPAARAVMHAVLLAIGVAADSVEDEPAVARALVPLIELEDRGRKVVAKGGAVITEEDLARVDALRAALAADPRTQPLLGGVTERPTDAALAVKAATELLGAILDRVAMGLAAIAEDAGPHALTWAKEGPQRPEEGLVHRAGWAIFRTPQPIDHQHLVHLRRPNEKLPEISDGPVDKRRARDGFALTDRRHPRVEVANEVDYCILCHDREKDSCRRGVIESPPKKPIGKHPHPVADPPSTGGAVITRPSRTGGIDVVDPAHVAEMHSERPTPKIKHNALGVPLYGCPLEERIGEMHELRREGLVLGSLALIAIDNPMCAGTGHRICNDCMKACIYQKQDPVNIPQAETGVLTDVLRLPWGVEIYGFLQRWNPLNARRPYALPYNGKNVLVVGMGPAGYTLAHHLVNDGFGVVGIDGLKIEPMEQALVGDAPNGVLPEPVYRYEELEQELDRRRTVGFGGVAEYGITIRWDKNFNDLLATLLMRRPTFKVYGGVRFGGTITVEEAFRMGFDHVAIAAGAGTPTLVDVPNGLARGVRQASDFLMALQLTGAFKRNSLANLQVRLPAVVIGGGLTAIDTGTELAAYYVVQCERTLERIEKLEAERGAKVVWATFDPEEREVLEEQVEHGRAIRKERERAAAEGRAPMFQPLIDAWGGVTIAYRRTMKESPAYRLNHEEIVKALEEGVRFAEQLSPKEILVDDRGAARAVVFERALPVQPGDRALPVQPGDRADKTTVELPAKTICVAAGTSPNVTYERERPGTFVMDPKTKAFKPHVVERGPDGRLVARPDEMGFFTSYCDGTHAVTFYGDNLPRYAGSVVKAMASAKDGYTEVSRLYAHEVAKLDPAQQGARDRSWHGFARMLDDELIATIHEIKRLTPTIVEVVVHAPRAAREFEPGQFYRLQNFELDAPVVEGTPLVSEGIALTGAWVDKERGLLSTIVLEMGGSTRLCASWKSGQRVVLMGPTGAPTEIPKDENVVLAGGGLGNAVLFSIGKALRNNGCKVVYFAGYRNPEDVYHVDDIEAAADLVIWSCDREPAPAPRRPQDRSFVGNIVQAMIAFAHGELVPLDLAPFTMSEMDRIIVIGSDRMMAAVKYARHPGGALAPYVKPEHVGIASINSPMQCMMKEICAQCLQRQVDPKTGKVSVVFTCFNQDQDIDRVDFPFLASRLRASSAQEKLTSLWLDRLLAKGEIPRV